MTNYGKSNRLHARGWLAAALLGSLALSVHAADVPIPKPPNGAVSNPNYLEYQKTGNTYTWKPVGTTTPPGSGTVSFPSTSTVSDVTPKMNTTGDLPYQHKGGASAKVTISTGINKAAVAKAAASAVNDFAAAAAVAASNPYVQLSLLACSVFCAPLMEWGIEKLKDNGDGTFSVETPPNTAGLDTSDGYYWRPAIQDGGLFLSPSAACNSASYGGRLLGIEGTGNSRNCKIQRAGGYDTFLITIMRQTVSGCKSGSFVVGGACKTADELPKQLSPLNDYFQRSFADKPWNADFASIAAATIAMGIYRNGNFFTDEASIAGPGAVPISETVGKWPVNVLPGTTTPAPAGHTGPTDSGTQTTTTTTTATNTFKPGTSGTGGSGSSGSGSGPSMTTGTKTETKTSITNNITNNTSTSVTTNIETKDDAPKEPEKDFCEKNPEALACAEADTPEQDIPRDKVTISYEYADIFGNGACPADSYLNTHGQSLKVWDWQTSCDHIQDYFRPVLIACCAFAAFVIISAGVKE